MNLLLHTCCGPCALYPLKMLLKEDITPTLLYCNPNIHPLSEWELRLENLQIVADRFSLNLIVDPGYDPAFYLDMKADPERCSRCYDLRLKKTAALAAKQGFHAFSTTLFVSPYQNREKLLASGRKFELETLMFYSPDWRAGYREGQELAKQLGLYRQRYCGCHPSLGESKFAEKIRAEQAARASSPDRD
jgi:predicted adenine nucleotide alpha hydrolase (AANH) superfamily ATPase